jgi:lysylphosphatidylglycerol synthetase-like protein (DUF2156 family)
VITIDRADTVDGRPPPLRGWVRRTAALGRRAPVTLALVVVLWVVGAVTGTLVRGPGESLRSSFAVGLPNLGAGHWWAFATSGFWCAGLAGYVITTALLLGLAAPAENRIGSVRTAVLMVVTQVLGTAAGLAVVALGARLTDPWLQRLAADTVVGPSLAAVGVTLAASARLATLWRRRVRLVLLITLVMLALYSGALQDVLRLAAGVIGLLLGPVVLGRAGRRPQFVASGQETRLLVALVVAASAVGPMVAALSGTATGPLSVLRFLVIAPPPDPLAVQWVCADPVNAEDCLDLQFRLRLGGVGPAIMSLLPVLLLITLSTGLRRGRRFAWWGAVGINLLFACLGALLAVLTTSTPAERLVAFGGASDAQFFAGVATSVLQPLVVVALLVATRHRFAVAAPPGTHRGWVRIVVGTFVAVSVVHLVGSYLVRDQYAPVPGWTELLLDLPTRFLPPGYLGELEVAFLPVGSAATFLFEWTGVVFWTVTLVTTLWVLRRVRVLPGDAVAARDLLIRDGGSSLSWMTTWRGNSYWFDRDGRAAIAYRVIGRVAVTAGEPFGSVVDRLAAMRDFATFCAEHAWTPCFYSVGEQFRGKAQEMGWSSVQVAEETVVPLADMAFTGKKWQDVRTALNKAEKVGITAEWITFARAPRTITEQIRAISEEWIVDKGLPEMGFTLGGLDELADAQVRCLIAIDADRKVHGVTSWLPVYSDGTITGWTLDFMRRRDTGFRGVMEFLIASAAQRFQTEGATFMSLSGAPLARVDRGERPAALQRVLDLSGRVLEPVYGFRSLLAFKAKFQPEYRPLHMVYTDVAALPAIANAVGRAYLPDLGASDTLRLLRHLRRCR